MHVHGHQGYYSSPDRKVTMMPFSKIIPGEFVVCLTKGLFTKKKERGREREMGVRAAQVVI